jgi:hypothetical protein
VEEQEVRPNLLCLLEDLWQGRQGDEYPVDLAIEIPDLEPDVVPIFRQSPWGYLLYGLGYLSHAHHLGRALYNLGPWISHA